MTDTSHLGPVARAFSVVLIALIRVYQLAISPLLGPSCRFQPTCSRYAVDCLSTHGPLRGSWLAVKRIARCHPWNPGGYDPPPPAPDDSPTSTSPAPNSNRSGQTNNDSPGSNRT